mmetsp:Transcript_24661/g.50014  ORF Transcript_24661/g.50014 Transcript_24661/m.50014 type:complete len:178 (-) Transcript_24661:52-585(-)
MWFFDAPANNERIFSMDASWDLLPAPDSWDPVPAASRQPRGGGGKVSRVDGMSVTQDKYSDQDNQDDFVRMTTGGRYEVAEWSDLKAHYAAVGKEQFCKDLQLERSHKHNEKLVFVNCDGESHLDDSRRKFFVQRFDREVPGGWLAHDVIDDGMICLGSWWDLSGRVAIKACSAEQA